MAAKETYNRLKKEYALRFLDTGIVVYKIIFNLNDLLLGYNAI